MNDEDNSDLVCLCLMIFWHLCSLFAKVVLFDV